MMSQNSQIITEFDNIPTLPYKEWLREVTPPKNKFKIVKLGKNEIKQSTMTEVEKSEYQAFWLFHNSICKTGCFTGGDYISGWLYWHLNYIKIPTDVKEELGARPHNYPDFRDNEHMIAFYLEEARRQQVPIMLFGTRRATKSVFINSRLCYRTHLFPNSTSLAVFGNKKDMGEVGNYFDTFIDSRPECFEDIIPSGSPFKTSDLITFDVRLSKKSEVSTYSKLNIANLDMGQSNRTEEALAGQSPSEVIFDEALCENTIIPTPSGETTMRDLKIGDYVFGKNGNPVRVVNKVDVGVKQLYKVNLIDGRSLFACEDHNWEVWDNANSGYGGYKKLKTKQLFTSHGTVNIDHRSGKEFKRMRYSIDLPQEVQYENTNVAIDPYYLGLFLGDGDKSCGGIATPEFEIETYLQSYFSQYECNTDVRQCGHSKVCNSVYPRFKKGKRNPIKELLKSEELLFNKHIPSKYIQTSVFNRRELLAGLLDTDGTITSNGCISFSNTDTRIIDGFIKLVASLGIRYKVKTKNPFYRRNGEKVYVSKSYEVFIFPTFNPFKVKRKADRFIAYDNKKAEFYRKRVSIYDITEAHVGQAYCITVDAEDSLFLAGNYIVTSNCGKYPFQARYDALKPGLMTKYGARTSSIFCGTGGMVEMSKDAEKMFLNAGISGILQVDFNKYKEVTKHFVFSPKSNADYSLLIPGEMTLYVGDKMEEPFKDTIPFSEYTNRKKTKKQLEELEGLTIDVTKWSFARRKIEEHIANEYKKSEDSGNKARMYYPFEPEDCFMFKESNPFNTVLALERIKYLEDNNMYGESVELSKINGKITVAASDKQICKKLPFEGGTIDAPIQIYEHPDFENPSWGSYVAGYDGVRLDVVTSTSNSLISLYVIKMINFSFKIVASYVTRPERMNKAYEQCHLLLEYYNAFCLPERDDQTGFKSYLQAKNRIDLLSQRIYHDKNEQFKFIYKESDYGQPSSDARSKKILTALPIAYCNNDNGEIDDANEIRYEARGIEEIPDIMLLKELVSFKKINMDRYWSWAHALMLGEEIAKNNFLPQNNINEKNDEGRRVIKREIRRSGNRNVRRIR